MLNFESAILHFLLYLQQPPNLMCYILKKKWFHVSGKKHKLATIESPIIRIFGFELFNNVVCFLKISLLLNLGCGINILLMIRSDHSYLYKYNNWYKLTKNLQWLITNWLRIVILIGCTIKTSYLFITFSISSNHAWDEWLISSVYNTQLNKLYFFIKLNLLYIKLKVPLIINIPKS